MPQEWQGGWEEVYGNTIDAGVGAGKLAAGMYTNDDQGSIGRQTGQAMDRHLRTVRFVWPASSVLTALLLTLFSNVHASPASAPSPVYEVTAKLGPLTAEGLRVSGVVKPDVPFRFFTNSGPDHFMVSGTVREENPEHLYLENFKMEGLGMSSSSDRMCDIQEARRMNEKMKAFLGPYDKAVDPYEAGCGFGCCNGPYFSIILKQKHRPSSGLKTGGSVLAILGGPVPSSSNSSGLYNSTGVGGPQGTNQFGFNITGSSNLVIVIEASTNLLNPTWYPLQTNTLNGSTLYFSDPQWTNNASRFYRVTWP